MKKVKKLFNMILLNLLLVITPTMLVYAESGSYESTYDMTGGLYSARTWDATATPTFTVSTSNCYSVYEGTIYVMLEKKKLLGWSTKDDDELDARTSGSCTLVGDGAGTYRIYIRQLTGFQMTGDITIEWVW
ncbi:MAG: hypothetical protein NC094_11005 [Bacteroidales bacterium]|nr:hypothetical protein [Lachnoclostridium sp.]MCM1382930.1 hypothetical protein [Lachnoclostridium sp.]MCM1465936.1 hypothetical protein [Bacteroidales bacterium]